MIIIKEANGIADIRKPKTFQNVPELVIRDILKMNKLSSTADNGGYIYVGQMGNNLIVAYQDSDNCSIEVYSNIDQDTIDDLVTLLNTDGNIGSFVEPTFSGEFDEFMGTYMKWLKGEINYG